MRLNKERFIHESEDIRLMKVPDLRWHFNHSHEFVELGYVLEGSARQTLNGHLLEVRRGDLMFLNTEDEHEVLETRDYVHINVLFLPSFLDPRLSGTADARELLELSAFREFGGELSGAGTVLHFSGEAMVTVEALLEKMVSEFTRKLPGYRMVLQGCLTELLGYILRAARSQHEEPLRRLDALMPELLRRLQDTDTQRPNLSELAEMSHYHPTYFSRLFKEHTGKNVTRYLQEMRIREACRLLWDTDMTVEAVCHAVGYSDRKQFYEVFRRITGQTPGAYRQARTLS